MTITVETAIQNIVEVLNGASLEYVAQVHNQVCSDKIVVAGQHFAPLSPLGDDPLLPVLEQLGYDVSHDSDQPGKWLWVSPWDGCTVSFDTPADALDDAWRDAAGRTMGAHNLSSEEWDRLSFERQHELMLTTL